MGVSGLVSNECGLKKALFFSLGPKTDVQTNLKFGTKEENFLKEISRVSLSIDFSSNYMQLQIEGAYVYRARYFWCNNFSFPTNEISKIEPFFTLYKYTINKLFY